MFWNMYLIEGNPTRDQEPVLHPIDLKGEEGTSSAVLTSLMLGCLARNEISAEEAQTVIVGLHKSPAVIPQRTLGLLTEGREEFTEARQGALIKQATYGKLSVLSMQHELALLTANEDILDGVMTKEGFHAIFTKDGGIQPYWWSLDEAIRTYGEYSLGVNHARKIGATLFTYGYDLVGEEPKDMYVKSRREYAVFGTSDDDGISTLQFKTFEKGPIVNLAKSSD
jgi:hypothetical protein